MATEEEVRRVSDAMFLADEAAGPFGAGYKKKAEAAITALRAMDREKATQTDSRWLHEARPMQEDDDSPKGT